jgi:hypothetical protein
VQFNSSLDSAPGQGFRMSLHGNQPCLNLLFSTWTLDTRWKFIFATLGVFVFAILVEGFSKLRFFVVHTVKQNTGINNRARNRAVLSDRQRWVLRACIPIFHGVQALAGYTLMLISMTFSLELLLAVVLGLTTGYAIFFDLTNIPEDPRQHVTNNPCCEYMEEECKEAAATDVTDRDSDDALLILDGEEDPEPPRPSRIVP